MTVIKAQDIKPNQWIRFNDGNRTPVFVVEVKQFIERTAEGLETTLVIEAVVNINHDFINDSFTIYPDYDEEVELVTENENQ